MKNIIYLLLFAFLAVSCENDDLSGPSPSERNKESIESLRKELVEAPYGWKVMYFPKMDSLLFADRNQAIESVPNFRTNFGFGGHYFIMKFDQNGTMKMLWDNTESTTQVERMSDFEIRQNTYTQLSFTTPNYIHNLVNEQFSGKSDFLYKGKDFDGNLIFKTVSYVEPGREYIVFEKLKKEEDAQDYIGKAYQNRKFFDEMESPQITIHRGSRIFFQSDMKVKFYTLDSERATAERMEYQRYHYFRFNKRPNIINGGTLESNALGSGYVGTETGITFRPGIQYNSTYIFRDFERQGDKFVCELVRVYDPILKIYRMVSKHLAPADAEETGYIAEIQITE